MNKIMMLGEEITSAYPRLLEWAKENPATLERTLLSMSKAYRPEDQKEAVGSAMATLEMNLQHGAALPEDEPTR